MVNRNVTLYSMLLDMWSRDLSVSDTLHYCTIMGFSQCVVEPLIKPAFTRFSSEYNAAMTADPLAGIIEAAYHCAWSNEDIHAAIKAAGLDQTSDETITLLLGEYGEAI